MSDTPSTSTPPPVTPVSVLDQPTAPPIPGGSAPSAAPKIASPKPKARKASKAAKRTTRRPGHPLVDAAADAAAQALEREAAAKRGPGRPSKAEQANDLLYEGLLNFYVGLGGLCQVAGLFLRQSRLSDTGQALIVQGPQCAKALLTVADQSPAVRRALEAIALGGGASLVIAAHGPIVAAALGFGPPPPVTAGSSESDDMGPGFDISSLLGMAVAAMQADDGAAVAV